MKKILISVLSVATVVSACVHEEHKSADIETYSVNVESFGAFTGPDSEILPFQWSEGDSITLYSMSTPCVFKALSSGDEAAFSGLALGQPSGCTIHPSSASAAYASSTVYAMIPSTQKAVPDSFDPEAVFCAGFIDKGRARMECLSALLRFSVSEEDVEFVSIQADGSRNITGNCRLSAVDGRFGKVSASSPSVTLRPEGDGPMKPGRYCAVVAPAELSSGITARVYRTDGTVEEKNLLSGIVLEAGKITDIGDVCGGESGDVTEFAIELKFKKEEALYDYNTAGAIWPFQENKGSSSNKITSRNLTTLNGGIPLTYSGDYYYLNSRAGLRLSFNNSSGYMQLPAIDGARLVRVTFGAGNNKMSPRITDDSGNTLQGGESQKCSDASLHVWELGDTGLGEGARIVFGDPVVNIMQLGLYYECHTSVTSSKVESVMAADDRNLSLGSDDIRFSGKVTPAAGSSVSELKFGFEYRKALGGDKFTKVECRGSETDFSATITLEPGQEYIYRAWACNKGAWKTYSVEHSVRSRSVLVDFWRFSEASQPFEADIPVGSTAAQALSGMEQAWTVKDTRLVFGTFCPTGSYMDLSSAKGLRVSASGSDGPLTWLKIPSVEGKSIKGLIINTSGLDSEDLCISLAKNVSSPLAARNSAVSATILLGQESGNNIYTMKMEENAPCYLVFNTKGNYYIRSIEALYADGGSAPFVEEPDDPSADPSGTFDYAALAAKGHPRLFFDNQDFADINSKVILQKSSNPVLYAFHNKVMSRAQELLGESLPTYTLDESDHRLLSQSRDAEKILLYCAYAYRMTADERYLWKCREVLKAVCGFPDWHPSHFLDVAEMSFGVALAYDWLYYDLPLEERETIHARLRDFALTVSDADSFYSTMNNWNQVCNAGMMASAMAIYEKDKAVAVKYIEKALASNKVVNDVLYAPDGAYIEGYNYWDYGTLYETFLIRLLERGFGTDAGLSACNGFLKTSEYMLFMAGIDGTFSYSDGGTLTQTIQIGQWWFAAHAGDSRLLYNELMNYDEGLYSSSDSRVFPLLLAFAKDVDLSSQSRTKPGKKVWSSNGSLPIVMVHTDWTYSDTDHYLGIKGGAAGMSHGHMDAGEFVYDALGERWSADRQHTTYTTIENAFSEAGFPGELFNNGPMSHRWDVFNLNNLSHSTLSVGCSDGSVPRFHPTDHYVYGAATIDKIIETPTELGARLDMTPVYTGQLASAYRTVKLVGGKDLYVIDELTALPGMDAPVSWRMVTKAALKSGTSGITLTRNEKEMFLSATSSPSAGLKYMTWDCTRPTEWEKRNWDPAEPSYRMAGFTATVPAGKTVTFTTKLSPNK